MDIVRCFLSMLLGAYALTVLVHAQNPPGFVSIDCGISKDSSYTDMKTGIYYTSDETFINTGISRDISPEIQTNKLEQQFWNVRSFPQGIRNCYTLKPPQVKGYKYLIRASFMYGNYDAQNQIPEFDLLLGVTLWDSVILKNTTSVVTMEIITSSNNTDVCLVNTGLGTPFISVLELRLLKNTSYVTQSGSGTPFISLFVRLDFGSTTNQVIRYGDDVYDRIWSPFDMPEVKQLSTSLTIDTTDHTDFQPPSAVMRTAVTPQNASDPLKFYWEPVSSVSQFYFYIHFAELEELQANQSREFNVFLNGNILYGPVVPDYLYTTTIYSVSPASAEKFEFSIEKTENSTLPPIINAIEVYMVKEFLQSQTVREDVDAIMDIKQVYNVTRNWQGDPCVPRNYTWDGLNCSYTKSPRIISLNLASSGLTGKIVSSFSNLKSIKSLDLSNNDLTGPVPEFIALMPSLKTLNLTRNNLSGSIPEAVMEKVKNKSLNLSVGENPNLCPSASCKAKKAKKKFVVPIVATIVSVLVLFLLSNLVCWYCRRKKQGESNKEGSLKSKNQEFTFSELVSITDNFKEVIGKGGFGKVYLGTWKNGNQVAVKLHSPSSDQGPNEFRTEAQLLMRVHHRNLVPLIGYCNEGIHMALVYEYMANGNLRQYLSAETTGANVLNWQMRLQIAIDAAQGLEYLHNGCKPPIIHRDMKTTNILLNEKLQAKIADFGLSRDFKNEGDTHVSTNPAGTPAYIDPKYHTTGKFSKKSDVYSFGIILVELITGQGALIRRPEYIHIIEWVSPIIEGGDIQNIVDQRLQGEFSTNSAWKAVDIAMSCVRSTAIQRPDMSQVVVELKECLAIEMVPEGNQGMVSSETRPSNNSHEMATVNLEIEIVPNAR